MYQKTSFLTSSIVSYFILYLFSYLKNNLLSLYWIDPWLRLDIPNYKGIYMLQSITIYSKDSTYLLQNPADHLEERFLKSKDSLTSRWAISAERKSNVQESYEDDQQEF